MLTLDINGKKFETDAEPDTPLLWVLRDHLGMTGSKYGCGKALCGACTVHVDGTATRSCVLPVSAAATMKITTIEAIGNSTVGKAVQDAWIAEERASVRLLPVRPGDERHGLADDQQEADGRGYRRGHVRQHLPLRHLRAHSFRDQARCQRFGLRTHHERSRK